MTWTRYETFAIADNGAMIDRTEEGWAALPFGADGGAIGVFASAEDAIAAADSAAASARCCYDEGT